MIDEAKLYRMVGERLKSMRVSQSGARGKLTQAELALKVGLERTSITNIEKGEQKLSLHVLFSLCDVLEKQIFDVIPPVHEVHLTKQEPLFEEVQLNDGDLVKVPPSVKQFYESIN